MTKIDAVVLLNRTFSLPEAALRRAMQQSFDAMRRPIPPPGPSSQKVNTAGSTIGIVRRHRAFQLTRHYQVEQIFVDEWRGQKFAEYATEWERAHSAILVGGSVRPLVDENGTVVGHVGIFRGDQIFVQGEETSVFQNLDVGFKNALVIADKRYGGKQFRATLATSRIW